VALPHEAPDRGERCDHWHNHYNGKSPSSLHLTNQCARATLLADRIDDYTNAQISKQLREDKEKWRRKQKRRARYLAGQLQKPPSPREILEEMKAFGAGVGFLIGSFEALIRELRDRGQLCPKGVKSARLMLGIPEEENENRRNRLAYWLTVNTLGCTPEDEHAAAELAGWLEPANRPLPMRDQPVEEFLGADAAACRAALSQRFRQEANALRELHTQVVKDVDEPALLEVLQCASILKDDAARRVLRAHADVRATFHKAWRDLVLVLESDEEEGLTDLDDDNDQDQDGEPGVTVEAAAEVVVPEEPATVSTASDPVSEPACGDPGEFLPFQPEKNVEHSAQPVESVVACDETSAARVGGAKWVPAGGEGRADGAQNRRSGGCPDPVEVVETDDEEKGVAGVGGDRDPDRDQDGDQDQEAVVVDEAVVVSTGADVASGTGCRGGCAAQSAGGAPAIARPSAGSSQGESCGDGTPGCLYHPPGVGGPGTPAPDSARGGSGGLPL
jgi:hypothetical protein